MSYQVTIPRSKAGAKMGTPVINAFIDIHVWIANRDWTKGDDFEVRTEQQPDWVFCIWDFKDKTKAILLKLTWGGNV